MEAKVKWVVEYWEGHDNSFHELQYFDVQGEAESWACNLEMNKPLYVNRKVVYKERL